MTTGKTIALTRWTFVGKVMSLLFNMLSKLVITLFPRSKCLLISWLQSTSAVIWEPRKIKLATVPTVSPSICHEVMGPDALILVFWMLNFKPAFKNPSSMRESWVQSLGWEDPLEKGMATHSSTLAWRIPWREEPGRLLVHGVAKSRTRLGDFTFTFDYPISLHKLVGWLVSGVPGYWSA